MNAQNAESGTSRKTKEFYSLMKTCLITIAAVSLLRLFVFEFVNVEKTSMYPTINDGDKLFVLKAAYIFSQPQRGDIAIVKISDSESYVKRVIGRPGETIEIKDSTVYINGLQINEDYLPPGLEYPDFPLTAVPEDSYFLIGDNRFFSKDSRHPDIGFINKNDFIGKVLFRLSPFTSFS